MRRWGLVLATLITCVAGNAHGQAHPGTIDITISARSPNSVRVEERYTLAPSAPSIELQALTRPCVVIENMRVELNGVAQPLAETHNGPWITWRETTRSGADSVRLLVRYDAWLGGSGAVPLVHLAAPLAREPSRQGAVTVAVRFTGIDGEVAFPHMTRQAPNEWSGRYIAAPSFVKVSSGNKGCDRRLLPPLADGGLAWRFSLLVGIMVAWVPLYLAWARRTGDRG